MIVIKVFSEVEFPDEKAFWDFVLDGDDHLVGPLREEIKESFMSGKVFRSENLIPGHRAVIRGAVYTKTFADPPVTA